MSQYTRDELNKINLLHIVDNYCKTNPEWKTLNQCYKKLALRYHPDKNPDNPSAEEKFKKISSISTMNIYNRDFDDFRMDDFNGDFYNRLRREVNGIKDRSIGRKPQSVPNPTHQAKPVPKPKRTYTRRTPQNKTFISKRTCKKIQDKLKHFMNVVVGVIVFILFCYIFNNNDKIDEAYLRDSLKRTLNERGISGGGNKKFRELWVTLTFVLVAAIVNFGDATGFISDTSNHIKSISISKENDLGEFGSLFINGINEMEIQGSLVPNQTPTGNIFTRDKKITIPNYVKWPQISISDMLSYVGITISSVVLNNKLKKAFDKLGKDNDIAIKNEWKTKFDSLIKVVDTLDEYNDRLEIANTGIVEKKRDSVIQVSVKGMIDYIKKLDEKECPVMKFGKNGYPTANSYDKFIINIVKTYNGNDINSRIRECTSIGFAKRLSHDFVKVIDELDKVFDKKETHRDVKEITDSDILEYEKGAEVVINTLDAFNSISYFNSNIDSFFLNDTILDDVVASITKDTHTIPWLVDKAQNGADALKKLNKDVAEGIADSATVWCLAILKSALINYPRFLFLDFIPDWFVLICSCIFYYMFIHFTISKIGHFMALSTACIIDPGSLTGENDKIRKNNLAIEQERTERARIESESALERSRIESESALELQRIKNDNKMSRLQFYSDNPQLTNITDVNEPLLLTNSTRKNKKSKKKRRTQKKSNSSGSSNSSGTSGTSGSNASKK
jgi:hypothetical protein